MANTIGTAYIQIEPTTEGIGGKLSSALNSEATAAGASAGGKLSSALGSAAKIGGAAILGLTTAVAGTTTALVGAASSTAEYGDGIDKMSQKLGVSAGFYQEWDAVLQHSGTSMDSMSATFKKLATASQDATKDQAEAFSKLGISMEQVSSMSTEELFTSVITGLQGMEEGTERTALATQLLGRGSMELGALLNTSAADTQAMINEVNNLGGVMSDDAVKASAQFQDSLQNLQTAFSGVKNSAMAELLPAFSEIMDGFSELVSTGEDSEGKITAGFEKLASGIQRAMPAIVSSFSTIIQSVLKVAPELIKTLAQGIIDALPELIPVVGEVIQNIAQTLIELLPELIEVGLQIIVQLAMGIAQSLPELIPALVEVLTSIVEYLIENVDILVEAAIALMQGLAQGLINALPVLIEKIPEIITNLVMAIIQNAPLLAEAATEIIFALASAIVSAAVQLIQPAIEILAKFGEYIQAKVSQLFEVGARIVQTIADAIRAKVGALVQAAQELIAKIKNAFINQISQFMEVGRQMVEGIKKGFADAWNSVKEWLSGMIGNIIDWAKEILGIHSPSKAFADEVGRWIPAGIAKGIENNIGTVKSAMSAVTDELMTEGLNTKATFDAAVNSNVGLYKNYGQDNNHNNEVIELLKSYLPMLAQNNNVNVTLEGDARQIFNVVRQENRKIINATGFNAFA